MSEPQIPPPERETRPSAPSAGQSAAKPTPQARASSGHGGGVVLAWLVGGLILIVAVIGWFFYAGVRPAAPEPPGVNLDISIPEPRLPSVPDRPAPRDLPRPVEPPNVAASPAPSTPSPET